ncbi:MAG: hypothetical protein V3S69_03685 [Dehalococcoidales bacterium]
MSIYNNSGGLWPCTNPHPKAPAYTGTITVEGKHYKIAAWHGAGRGDMPAFTLKLTTQDSKKAEHQEPLTSKAKKAYCIAHGDVPPSTPVAANAVKVTTGVGDNFDDDGIPF